MRKVDFATISNQFIPHIVSMHRIEISLREQFDIYCFLNIPSNVSDKTDLPPDPIGPYSNSAFSCFEKSPLKQ